MHEKPQKRAGVDLYIVHKAIQLPRASTNQQKSKRNKNHKKQNTQKTTKQTKQHKNKTKNRAKGQQCALEMNSDSSLCAILRAGHHTSRRMQMTTSVPCQRRPLNKKTTKTPTTKSPRATSQGAEATQLNAETRDPPSQDPRDLKEQPSWHNIAPKHFEANTVNAGSQQSGEKLPQWNRKVKRDLRWKRRRGNSTQVPSESAQYCFSNHHIAPKLLVALPC